MSFVFYGWWDWRFLLLIIGSGLIDYIAAILIRQTPAYRKLILIVSLAGNLGSLFIFKYSVFFANLFEDVFATAGFDIDLVSRIPEFALILPVGISFYTFQSMSYTIDVYRGRLEPTKNILLFFSFLSMFPQLVAGPIIRARDILNQLSSDRDVSVLQKWHAVKLIAYGLFQKVVIADNLSFFIDSAFENKSVFDGSLYWWMVMIAFSFQIYCDFSGYSLIARGLAKYMGYHFRVNFNHPYLATSLKNFWSRWHISLSTWFRDYVYIPLGGSRNGLIIGILLLWFTMILSGLWHGANYTFLIWAIIHSLFLSVERITNWPGLVRKMKFSFLIIPFIFVQVLIAWIYFRAENVHQANSILLEMLRFTSSDLDFFEIYFDAIFFMSLALLIEIFIWFRKNKIEFSLFCKKYNLDILTVSIAVVLVLFFRGEGKQFIYFQF
ncbi:MAG: MBOAT family protein [Crocinitomicaceae bacterium]|nr:MBOAT family protein [Crocinitomicaceae bacterium]